ncbi:putative protein N(5)-glutamine methyltransferase [Myceligenerans xiligouense]|uniref:Release factor glutamine methyltransferase n=1 Tax=Myceligenerans xiligouense TaxID=253184 RepID=A0A3N4YGX3_9MICO|nr:putative protein N(5)-glutamine methyltransferase [Myceligenerans xiligouense]RPF20063.1 release factor glutamine methyltransferase [Myceligenerans xiligouense]
MTSETEPLVSRLRAAGCVFAEEEALLLLEAAGADPERLERLARARIGGAPLEQVVGWAEFWGRRWTVAPGVFVPRRRSELLVAEALAHLRVRPGTRLPVPAGTDATGTAPPASGVVVDLCCGCGALGGSVALDLVNAGADVELHASDIDPVAAGCARRNLAGPAVEQGTGAGGLTVVVHDGDLDAPLPESLRGRVDVLLCNAPYVPTEAIALMPREARDHEPRLALDGGADGLGILRRAITAAPGWLRPGGVLLFETGHDQAEAAATAARRAGLTPRIASDETLGATAVVAAQG